MEGHACANEFNGFLDLRWLRKASHAGKQFEWVEKSPPSGDVAKDVFPRDPIAQVLHFLGGFQVIVIGVMFG